MSITAYIERFSFGLAPIDLAAALAAVAAALVVFFLWFSLLERDRLPERIEALRRARQGLSAKGTSRRRKSRLIGLGTADSQTLMRLALGRMKLLRGKAADAAKLKLARAGLRSRDALILFLFAKLVAPLAAGLLAVLLVYVIGIVEVPDLAKAALTLAATLIGAYAPDLFVANRTQKRLEKIRLALPDALDLLVVCAEAGLSLDAALDRVSRESAEASPEVAEELGLAVIELGFLPRRQDALDGLASRVPLPSVKALTSTLVQTERYGTPLAQALRVLSGELRHERMMRAEEKAARLPATMTVPLIAFILPPLFVVLIGPAAIDTIDALSKL